MKSIGSLLIFYGILTIVLDFFNYVPRIMQWVYSWGDTTGWILKIGFVVVGYLLLKIEKSTQS